MFSILAILTFISFVFASAPVSTDSPEGTSYVATFPETIDSGISGSVRFDAANNGSVIVSVNFTGLPDREHGPFAYSIQEYELPADGNCSSTGDVWNPFNGDLDATSSTEQHLFAIGDLSGKHGNITGNSIYTEYYDNYLSVSRGSDLQFVGRQSVVLHGANGILRCQNVRVCERPMNNLEHGNDANSNRVATFAMVLSAISMFLFY
ncbi:unnamed protein product [Candida verbasci]|uniref:Superoxide dismutase copper/zinc binding domain-containing protein n=1 Tax=Candida verbasci TaxID=1227364 RepID=A0A9W4TTZ9_9ASCO|nr:unnamed protein product [Candida verbasci]